jgi:hypothetical protein
LNANWICPTTIGMSLILNPRGAAGSGKTELVRRILAGYGWPDAAGEIVRLPDRARPIGFRLAGPRPLAVIGDYDGTAGGCDTIRRGDGGLPEAVAWAGDRAGAGDDVLIEGFQLSRDHRLSAALASSGRLHVLRLTTPPARCARNLVARQKLRRDAWRRLSERAAAQSREVAEACATLPPEARVEALDFDAALARAHELLGPRPDRTALGVPAPGAAAGSDGW